MALADARAILPDLVTRLAEPERDAAFLRALHRWAMGYSPLVACDGADGLLLDITGCAHLFGGEQAMLADMIMRAQRLGVSVQAACADSQGAAWALARQDAAMTIAPEGEMRRALAGLPLGALRVDRDTVAGLNRLGFACIEDLFSVPRASLARRFGLDLVLRLDQALGFTHEPVCAAAPPQRFAARLTLPEPIGLVGDVREAARRVLTEMCARLAKAEAGARAVRLQARRVDASEEVVDIGLAAPSRDAAMMLRLLERPLEGLDAGFGIDAVRVEARHVEPLSARQLSGEPSAGAADALDETIARIGNRLGFDRVRRFAPGDSHLPERAFVHIPATHRPPKTAWRRDGPPRPLTMFPPEPVNALRPGRPPGAIFWRGRRLDVVCAAGPERIAPEWWRRNPGWSGRPVDFWRIEAASGERLWLRRSHQDAAGSERGPDWHVCGAFP